MSLEDKAQAWRGPSIPGAVQRSPSRGPCPVNRSRAPGHVYFQDWGLRAEPQSWCWGEACLSSYEPRPRSRRVHGFSPSTPSTTSVDSYSSQLLWEAGAQIRRGAGPGLRGAAPARLWGSYLAVKETWRVTEVGGALTGRASSSPLLGDTLKATGSLSGSCWPAGWGGRAGSSTHRLRH